MKFVGLILKSARRSKRRTALTMISVALAVFLFSALRAVLDGFDAVSAASSTTLNHLSRRNAAKADPSSFVLASPARHSEGSCR